ncbi:PDDEXK endonuclease [Streptomyces phage Jada]|nr:PDDEXK endonuclease [Streptomyces phage Jada]
MDRKTKGRLGEVKVLAYFIENGYEVYTPFSDCSKYDMIAIKDGVVNRVSVKYSGAQAPSGKWIVGLVQTSRRNNGEIKETKFNKDQYDIVAVYIGPEDRVELISASEIPGKTAIYVK